MEWPDHGHRAIVKIVKESRGTTPFCLYLSIEVECRRYDTSVENKHKFNQSRIAAKPKTN